MTLKMPDFTTWMSKTRTEKIMGMSIREFSTEYLAGRLFIMTESGCKFYCVGDDCVYESTYVKRNHSSVPWDIWEAIDKGDVTILPRRSSKRCL